MNIGKLVSIRVVGHGRIAAVWDDDFAAEVDLSPVTALHDLLAPLRDPATFRSVQLSSDGWSIEWPSGLDFGAAQLRHWATNGTEQRHAA